MIYFNNKYYWKKPPSQSEIGYKTPHGGGGSSWWLLDEPNHYYDFRAISFFGYLAKRWLGEFQDVPMTLRTDISRVNWIRDLLAGRMSIVAGHSELTLALPGSQQLTDEELDRLRLRIVGAILQG